MDAFEAVSASRPSSARSKRYFTPAEATRSLTLVRRIVQEVVLDYRQLRELHEKCRPVRGKGRTAEAEAARQRYLAITDHLSDLKEELDKVGCELKDCEEGLIDFPGRIEGREISLCWKLGEEKVAHWHEPDSGFAGRQPIDETLFSI